MMRKRATVLFVSAMALAVAMPVSAMAQSAGNVPQQNQEQVPQPDGGGVNWKGVGVGAGTIAGNLLYIPAKLVYGILGGIAGGAGYVLTGGNSQVSNTIWRSSLGGDYVLTPKMLTGQQPVRFSGPTQTAPPATASTSTSGSLTPVPSTSSYSSNSYGSSASSAGTSGSSTQAMTSSSYGSSGYSSSSFGGSSARPLDHGAGPVRNSSSAPPLPDTNIE